MEDFLVHETEARGPCTDALVIGVGTYPHLIGGGERTTPDHEGMQQLSSPPVSARRIAQWLVERHYYPPKPLRTVSLLVSERAEASFTNQQTLQRHPVALATADNVVAAIKRWKARGDERPENRLLFYFCGHGIARGPEMALLLRDFGADADNSLDALSISGSCTSPWSGARPANRSTSWTRAGRPPIP